jgi:K+-sensing histidine kinase KdpD
MPRPAEPRDGSQPGEPPRVPAQGGHARPRPSSAATRLVRAIEAWRRRPFLLRLSVAMALLAAAVGLRLLAFGLTPGQVLPFLAPAVLLGSLLCRASAGVIMAITAWAVTAYLFIEPIGSFSIGNVEDAVVATLLLVAAIGATLVIEILWLLAEEDEEGG